MEQSEDISALANHKNYLKSSGITIIKILPQRLEIPDEALTKR